MATGDIKNNIKQLQHELKAAKYPETIDVDGLVNGSPKAYLGIYHYLFTQYSTNFNTDITNSNNELYGKSDMRFMEAVYKILRDMFDYKPQINREQFFSSGYVERKVIMATDILRLVRSAYKPPKSSTFKVAITKEDKKISQKILQEPCEPARKVASKSSTNIAGAVILPVRASRGCFKVPKSALPHLRLSSDKQFYHGTTELEKLQSPKQFQEKSLNGAVSVDVPETPSESSVPNGQNVDSELITAEVKRKVVDLLSPALLKMNEKIGQLDIAIQTLECKKTDRASIETPASTMMTAVFPASTVMTAGLAKQMNDVVFKLDTLTSRVVLLENRVMMLEARLEDESSRSHAFVSQSDNINSKKPPMVPTPRHKVENPIRENDSIYRSKISQKEAFSDDEDETNRERIKRHNSADFDEESYNEASVNEIPVKIIRETSEGAELKTGFMKSLLNRDDSTLISDLSAIDLLDEKEESQIQVHSKEAAFEKETLSDSELKSKYGSNKSAVTNSDLFDAIFSPIRSFSDTKSCTGQGDGSEKKPSNKPQNSEDDRRSSTPTHMALDTSTLDRVSRITQMMAETKQLLH